jgi:hypothetical protein
MFPKLIALTVLVTMEIFIGALAGTSRAQETGSVISTTPDMPLSEFRSWRNSLLDQQRTAKRNRCRWYSMEYFTTPTSEVAPWNRLENIHYWKWRVYYARHETTKCPLPGVVQTGLSVRWAEYHVTRRWGKAQWNCLYRLWGPLESSWRWWADNPYSTAYGIPQALPGSKMGTGWQTHPVVQMKWGFGYVFGGRFSSACSALSYRLAHGSY